MMAMSWYTTFSTKRWKLGCWIGFIGILLIEYDSNLTWHVTGGLLNQIIYGPVGNDDGTNNFFNSSTSIEYDW